MRYGADVWLGVTRVDSKELRRRTGLIFAGNRLLIALAVLELSELLIRDKPTRKSAEDDVGLKNGIAEPIEIASG